MPAGITPAAGIAAAHAPSFFATPPPAPQAPPTAKTMHILGGIGIAAVVVLAALFAFGSPVPPLPNETQAAGYRFGRFFAAVVIPFLIAYPIAGRRKARSHNLFAGLFCGIALFLILANVASSLGAPQLAVQHGR
jgi:hypothetical protein